MGRSTCFTPSSDNVITFGPLCLKRYAKSFRIRPDIRKLTCNVAYHTGKKLGLGLSPRITDTLGRAHSDSCTKGTFSLSALLRKVMYPVNVIVTAFKSDGSFRQVVGSRAGA